MEYRGEELQREVQDIKTKIDELHSDLKRFMERSNQLHVDSMLADMRGGLCDVLVKHVNSEASAGLQARMVQDCHMRKTCQSLFSELLQRNASLLKEDRASLQLVNGDRSALKDMRKKAPYPQCDQCFAEAESLLGKQVELMRSLRIYEDDRGKEHDLSLLPEEAVVRELLDPMNNRQRLQIMKSLAGETKTFSGLAELTGLRGGNLLFHLTKLQDMGMIMQRHERGDYMITEKGFQALKGVAGVYWTLTGEGAAAEADMQTKEEGDDE
ncbi:MAG: winged helix-turn-helix transcriptional regulator [Methanosarcinales archaeon]|nr:winged helix-turn-helix transcriptional regulator [Methanosarcinales archaeon]